MVEQKVHMMKWAAKLVQYFGIAHSISKQMQSVLSVSAVT